MLSQQKQYTAALDDLNDALLVEPDDAHTLLNRAYVYDDLEKYANAIYDSSRVTTLEPQNSYAWCELGRSQAKCRNWQKGLDACNKALELSPRYIYGLTTRSWIEGELGRDDKALADLATAIRIDPKDADIYYSRGILYRNKKNYSKSIADLSKAITINPRNEIYFCARGCSEVRNANYKEAITDCNKSIQLNPRRTHPYLSRGEAYSALGSNDLALRDFAEVIHEAPSCTEAFSERAKVYQKLHKTKLAALDSATAEKLKLAKQKGHAN